MIANWSDLSGEGFESLLIGNGFSIGVSDKFNYSSLLDTFDENRPLGRYWCTRELFDKFETTNFEEVLRGIYHAYLVSIDNENALKTLYNDLKNSLIEAVHNVHPPFKSVDTGNVADELQKYRSIYTTNYDLILYWSILENNVDSFKDFFWSDDLSFDGTNTQLIGNVIPIYYLHGGIHLKSTSLGGAKKLRVNLNEVNSYFDQIEFGEFPLFITEGKYKLKHHRINENDYLRFCYDSLTKQRGNLAVYGHSLSKEYDYHIVQAIKKSSIEKIAISVYSGLEDVDKELFIAEMNEKFHSSNQKLVYFESNSHPLCI